MFNMFRDFISTMNVCINDKLKMENQNKMDALKKFLIGKFLNKLSHNYLMFFLYSLLPLQYFQLFIQVCIDT